MTPLEARQLLAHDTKKLVRRTEKGRIPPESIGSVVLNTISGRIRQFGHERAARAATMASRAKISAHTHSDLFASRVILLLSNVVPRYGPDEARGILTYIIGDNSQHGISIVGLQLLSESSGVEAAKKIKLFRDNTIVMLEQQDKEMRRQIELLPPQIRRVIEGSFYEATLAMREYDDRTLVCYMDQVRRLVRRFSRVTPSE